MSEPHTPLSLKRVLMLLVPVAAVALAAYWWSSTLESAARSEMSQNVYARILSANGLKADESLKFEDKDGDLIADSPVDPAKAIAPDELVFSFVASANDEPEEETWRPVLDALAEKTGHKIKFAHFTTAESQLKALKEGELHVAALASGIVPVAVERVGFVPLCTYSGEDGKYGYTMQLIVPADSGIKKLSDLKGRTVTFTTPDSNSGCKALLSVLKSKEELQPDRDYSWGFSGDQIKSIKGVAAKTYEAAPVASDIVERMAAKGEFDPSEVRSIYESERFPPVTIGYLYNLSPELRTAIREALIGFTLAGTSLENELGGNATKFVPVNYKDDWANIRAIDQLVAEARKQR